jgi:hypothetical protein
MVEQHDVVSMLPEFWHYQIYLMLNFAQKIYNYIFTYTYFIQYIFDSCDNIYWINHY